MINGLVQVKHETLALDIEVQLMMNLMDGDLITLVEQAKCYSNLILASPTLVWVHLICIPSSCINRVLLKCKPGLFLLSSGMETHFSLQPFM
jgi:hypothetical protein